MKRDEDKDKNDRFEDLFKKRKEVEIESEDVHEQNILLAMDCFLSKEPKDDIATKIYHRTSDKKRRKMNELI